MCMLYLDIYQCFFLPNVIVFLKMIVIDKTYFYLKTIVVVTFVTQIHETSRQIKKVKIKIKSNHLVL